MATDQPQRDAALDVTRSFIVQAPAGSGKTALLVERYLRLLKTVRQPEEIVAITFTKKAAAEMRGRVTEHVSPELAPRLRIQTIDALCAALTARMPVLAKFGAQPAIAEDASELYREAAARTLAELTAPVTRLLAHLDNNVTQATNLLAGMLESRDRWLRQTGQAPTRLELEAALRAERQRMIGRAKALWPQASPELAGAVLTKAGGWRKDAPPELAAIPGLREALATLLMIPPPAYTDTQWEVLEAMLGLLEPAVAQLLTLFGERGEADFTQIAHGALAALGTPDEPTDLLLSMDVRVHHLLVDEFQDTSNSQWELIERLTAGWEEGDGRSVFLVGDPMQSIYRFRDAQVGLFLHARRHGLPAVKLHPLTLSANFRSQAGIVEWVNRVFPRVLPAAEDEISGAVPYSPSVWIHPPEPGGEPTLEIFADREGEARRVVELAKAASGKTAILVRNRSHLDFIVPALKDAGVRFRAVEIEQLGEKQIVQDLFALTRALTHLGDRIAWLAALRAPWCGLTLEELLALCSPPSAKGGPQAQPKKPRSAASDSQLSLWPDTEAGTATSAGIKTPSPLAGEVLPLLGEVAAAAPQQRSPSPLAGERQQEPPSPLEGEGSGERGKERAAESATIWELVQREPRLARIREVFAPALADRMRGTLRDRVEGVWLALGGPACAEDATELEDAEIFFDELERLEQAGALEDFSALGESLAKLYALPDVTAGPDAVEIMTIHKAKGLEFDTVIVPGLDRPPLAGRRPLFAWRFLPSPSDDGAGREGTGSPSDGGTGREGTVKSLPSPLEGENLPRARTGGQGERGKKGLLLAPIDETGGEKEPLYKYVRQLDREAEDIEAGRLFYVAATRAKSRLHLLTCVKADDHGAVRTPSKRGLLGLAWGALQGFSLPSPLAGEAPGERALPSARLRRLSADFELPRPPEATSWKSPEEQAQEDRIEFSWVGETARHVGTVAHAWLRRMADDQLAGWDADRIASLRATVRLQLAARGVSASEVDAAAEQVLTALTNTIADDRGRWVLGPHPEAKAEYRIRVRERRFVVDRVFRDQDGVQWVVDYKTSRHEGANLEAFLDEERKRYAAQLDAYAAVLGGARRGLYFPLHKGWRAW